MHVIKNRILPITAIMAFFMIYPGCDYHFRAGGEPMNIEIKSLAIPLMTSSSSYGGFEADFTRIIRNEFISHSKVPIVPTEEAGAVLSGQIYSIITRPLTYDTLQQTVGGHTVTYETTSSRKMKIRLDVRLTDSATGLQIWHDSSMEEEARFEVGPDPLANRYRQQQALMKIARFLAKRVYLKTMERF
jgi:hypothetical protein